MPPLLRSLSLNPLPSLQRKSPPRPNLWQRSPWKSLLLNLQLNPWLSLWQNPQLRSLHLLRR